MKIDTIIYCRVSTDDQADYGYGRDHQREVLESYCKIKEYGVVKEYLEDYSAKDFNRPEWKKLESFVKANRKNISRVLFTKWDRFSRNMEEAMRVIKKFRSWGITLNAVEQPLDLLDPNQKIMLSMYLIMPEVENDNISARTKDGLYRATKDGAFVGTPPYGYSRIRYGKYASMNPNKDAELLVEIFNKVALGVESLEGLRKYYRTKGYIKCKQTFYNMLKNRAYIGQVKVPEYKKDDAYWINGLHDAIIDASIFNRVQDVLTGRSRNAKPPSKKNEALPLRRYLECEYCGGTLTGSISKGNGGKYGYYHCRGKCKNRISALSSEKMLNEKVLKRINTNDNVLNLYKEIIIDTHKNNRTDKRDRTIELETKINDVVKTIENIEDKFAEDLILPDVFNRMLLRYEGNLMSLRAELEDFKNTKELSIKLIDKAFKTIRNIPQLYENGNFDQKTSLLGLLFPEKLIISKIDCRTKKTNVVIELLSRANKGFQNLDTKKAIKNDGLSNFAPLLDKSCSWNSIIQYSIIRKLMS